MQEHVYHRHHDARRWLLGCKSDRVWPAFAHRGAARTVNILVWHHRSLGDGTGYARAFAEALSAQPGKRVTVSAASAGLDARLAVRLLRLRRVERPRLAFCIAPASLNLLVLLALRIIGARIVVVVREADLDRGVRWHAGALWRRFLSHLANPVVALNDFSTPSMAGLGRHPRVSFRPPLADANRTGGNRCLLYIEDGMSRRAPPNPATMRLAEAMSLLPSDLALTVRVIARHPASPATAPLRALPHVVVEPRPRRLALDALIAQVDGVFLPEAALGYPVAAAAMAAGKAVIATRGTALPRYLYGVSNAFLGFAHPEGLAAAILDFLDQTTTMTEPSDGAGAWTAAVAQLLDDLSGVPRGVPNDGLPVAFEDRPRDVLRVGLRVGLRPDSEAPATQVMPEAGRAAGDIKDHRAEQRVELQ
jgi:glycosyltransferase involved in cell wall biosynthesis